MCQIVRLNANHAYTVRGIKDYQHFFRWFFCIDESGPLEHVHLKSTLYMIIKYAHFLALLCLDKGESIYWINVINILKIISMAYCKTPATLLLTHWKYRSLAQSHRFMRCEICASQLWFDGGQFEHTPHENFARATGIHLLQMKQSGRIWVN